VKTVLTIGLFFTIIMLVLVSVGVFGQLHWLNFVAFAATLVFCVVWLSRISRE
jgi:CHASE2 domain-containing sensor protein